MRWSPDAEEFWKFRMDGILNGAQPLGAAEWKEWHRGHKDPKYSSVAASWGRNKQVGYRGFRTRILPRIQRHWQDMLAKYVDEYF
jgi:hypothetical protein